MTVDLTRGPIGRGLIRFCLPLIAGNLLQQLYNVVDTWVVGRYLGQDALAAVGSAFSLVVLLTSVVLGLCMGSGVVFSQLWGQNRREEMRRAMGNALVLCLGICLVLTALSCALLSPILRLMNVPIAVQPDMAAYLRVILPGMLLTFAYNYMAAAERSVGNSLSPLIFLCASTMVNIALDLLFVAAFHWGIAGAAWATVIAQAVAAVGIALHGARRMADCLPAPRHLMPDGALMRRIFSVSAITSLQQSVMNFGILMIQSLVNSFGAEVMAAFAVGVKVDAFAYAPAQDFAGGYATFISQNMGAGQWTRIRRGVRDAFLMSCVFCAAVSALVGLFAPQLMGLFMTGESAGAIAVGVRYLRTEGLCYVGIGLLFLFYATFRGMEKPAVSLWLTVISLGLRVALAYAFAPVWGVEAIWWSIPIGWAMADIAGAALLKRALSNP